MRQLFCTLCQLFGLDNAVTRRAFDEARVLEERAVEAEQRRDAANLELVECPEHPPPRMLAVHALDDQLRNERVVERGNLGTCGHAGIDPHPRAARLPVARDPPGAGKKAVGRVLRVDAALDRVPG